MLRDGSPFQLADHEVFVLTAAHQGRERGQIVTWVMPGSLIPEQPRVVAVLSPANATVDFVVASSRFALSLLAEDQLDLLPRFGLRSSREVDKLAGLPVRRTASGLPVLEGCCGFADCRLVAHHDAGDRLICIADVIEQRFDPERRPLRSRQAFDRLPAAVREELLAKRLRDGERDRELRR